MLFSPSQFLHAVPSETYRKIVPLPLLIRKVVTLELTQQNKDGIFETNECVLKASKMSLKMPLPAKQLVNICAASGHAAGFFHPDR